jgi:hypothetical protein
MPLSTETLTANAEVADRLGWTFDLRVRTDPEGPVWFSVDGAEGIRQIGLDSTGGVFVQLSGSPRVLHVSSEGEAGILAADLDAFIGLLVACPHWRDVLKFSAGGNLEEMRRAAALLEAVTVDDEDLEEARALLRSHLGPTEPADPVDSLHRAVSTSDVVVRGLDGSPFGSLFNSFIIDESRMRRLFGG